MSSLIGYNDSSLTAFDFFAGGGGASLGLHRAGINVLAALNHSPVAIATHGTNFPSARHMLCDIRVQKSWGLGHAEIMWASPDCTHHSIAKGGQSRDAKERALAEELPRFAYNLNVNCIMVENVKEFLDWGPLEIKRDKYGKTVLDKKGEEQWVAIKARKKEYYNQWVSTLAALGFVNYEYRLINSADFGVPQSRVRYFGIFTRRGIPIVWPMPTHDKHAANGLPKWVAVRTVLDLEDRGRSIFTAWGKPIADKTLRRILAGLKKHVIGKGEAQFLDKRTSNPPSGKPGTGASINVPSPTTATCYLPDLVTPQFLCGQYGQHHNTGMEQPCPPLLTTPKQNLVSAEFMMKAYGGDPKHQSFSLDNSASTVTCADHHVLGTAYMLHNYGGVNRSRALCSPAATITTTGGGQYVITPVFLAQYNGGSDNCRVIGLDSPTNTVPTENRFGLVQCLMSYYGHGSTRTFCHPCPTLSTHDRFAVVGFMTSSHGCNPPYSLNQPAKTIVASRRHQYLVLAASGSPVATLPGDSVAMRLLKATCRRHGIADIFMRMLKVSELKLIMGFPADYYLSGSATKQKEMLGNAVVPQVSEAIARAMLPSLTVARLRKLPGLRVEAINRYEQGNVFAGKEVTHV